MSVKSVDLAKLASFSLNNWEKLNIASEFNPLFKTKKKINTPNKVSHDNIVYNTTGEITG